MKVQALGAPWIIRPSSRHGFSGLPGGHPVTAASRMEHDLKNPRGVCTPGVFNCLLVGALDFLGAGFVAVIVEGAVHAGLDSPAFDFLAI